MRDIHTHRPVQILSISYSDLNPLLVNGNRIDYMILRSYLLRVPRRV
jgi:hypothetical protein